MTSQHYHFHQFDPEQLRSVINGSDLEHTFLSSGPCSARINRIISPEFSVESGYYSFPVFVRGQFAPGKICIGMSKGRENPTWINGNSLDHPCLQIYAEGAEMLYRAGRSTDWMAVSINREDLQQFAMAIIGCELILPSSGMTNLPISPDSEARLFQVVRAAANSAISKSSGDRMILRAVLETIAQSREKTQNQASKSKRHHFELIYRADEALRQSIGRKYSSGQLCKLVGTSERSLQTHFREAYGMSPKSWFTRLALNHARSKLQQAGHRPGVVAEIAMSLGFEHLGRFSESYRELFGELPSVTVKQSP